MHFAIVLWIRIHRIRIRTRIQIQGLMTKNVRKNTAENYLNIFLFNLKTAIYSKKGNLLAFLYFRGSFLPSWIRIRTAKLDPWKICFNRAFARRHKMSSVFVFSHLFHTDRWPRWGGGRASPPRCWAGSASVIPTSYSPGFDSSCRLDNDCEVFENKVPVSVQVNQMTRKPGKWLFNNS